jgi:adenylate kinase
VRVAVTGTPGTGKTTATEALTDGVWEDADDGADTGDGGGGSERDVRVVHLNDVVREEGFHDGEDPERASLYADFDALADWLADEASGDDRPTVVESHLAHNFDADRVVVLRCHPETLERRLRERGESAATARENAEAEALDVLLGEAVERHGLDAVYEVDTTDRPPAAVAGEIRAVLAGEREPSAGAVDFTGWL